VIRVVCLLGSPRAGGNSDMLAERFCGAAAQAGAQIETFALRDMQFQGYTTPQAATPYGPDDDLAPALAAIKTADLLVMSTPIYFCNMTGLLKQAFDRFFCFFKPDYVTNPEPSVLGRNKALVLVQAQGEGPERYGDLLDHYGPALDKLGFARRDVIRACGVRAPGDLTAQPDILQSADTMARQLVADLEGKRNEP